MNTETKHRTAKSCQICGKVFYGHNSNHYCQQCAEIKRIENMHKTRVCQDCGNEFWGWPKSKRCPSCAHKSRLEAQARLQKSGAMRPLGSTDKCKVCGKEYIVVAGLQKYCSKDCQKIGMSNVLRERNRDYNRRVSQNAKREETRGKQEKICVYCLHKFKSSTSTNTCSDYCKNEQKKINQCNADIKRGKNRDLQKYLDRRDAYREKVLGGILP